MPIRPGDELPNVTLTHMTGEGPKEITTEEIFGGKRVVLFALPGAFTPTCSAAHLPGYVVHADAVKAKGVDRIVCLSVNDAFVMDAWAKTQNVDGRVEMIADGNGDFTRAVGLELDLRPRGLGVRSQRYAMVVDDGVVKTLSIDAPGKFEVSDAESVMRSL